MLRLRMLATVLLVLCLRATPILAQSTTWLLNPSGDTFLYSFWFADTNWTNDIPNPSVDAWIPYGHISLRRDNAKARDLFLGDNHQPSDGFFDIFHTNFGGTGSLFTRRGYIGFAADSSFSVGVSGYGSYWNNDGALIVGYQGWGSLLTDSLGRVTSGSGIIGDFPGASGEAEIMSHSTWNSGAELRVGNEGIASLLIAGGGTVLDTVGYIGFAPSSFGRVRVTGAGSKWTNSGDLIVGHQSTLSSSLDIEDGAKVSSSRGFIGDAAGATGKVSVGSYFSVGTEWNSGTELRVGNVGTGTLNVTNSGNVFSTVGYIGTFANSIGTATIDGAGSRWTMGAELRVGNEGVGTLNVTNGGFVTDSSGTIGYYPTSTGTVTVAGEESLWTNTSQLIVGRQSTATSRLNIHSRGRVKDINGTGPFGIIGDFANSRGEVVVDGAGSRWESSELWVGNFGTGTLSVLNDGDVTSTLGRIGIQSSSHGHVLVNGVGSTWTMTGDLAVGGAGQAGLTVSNGGNISAPGGVTIGQQGSVSGNGAIVANVLNHGHVIPAGHDQLGRLGISGNYTQSAFGTLHIELESADSYDSLSVNGNVALAGELIVSIIDDFGPPFFRPEIGDSFDILDWPLAKTLSGTFDSIQLPGLGGSRYWNTSQLYTTGVISVSAAILGDFNHNGDVDGGDFLAWQRNPSVGNLADWQANYGTGSLVAGNVTIPEPSTWLLLSLMAVGGRLAKQQRIIW